MAANLQNSIVFIHSLDEDNRAFGTGFVIHQSAEAIYVLTCAHVVTDVGGEEVLQVENFSAEVAAFGEEEGLDLAVLKVEALWDKTPLHLGGQTEPGKPFMTEGFQLFSKTHLTRPLDGILGDQVGLHSKRLGERIQAWDLEITDDYTLQPGYSGSPVVDTATNQVVAIVSHRQREGKSGLAISIQSLEGIWRMVDPGQVYRTLLKLGYRRQVQLFLRVLKKHSVAAFLIHGPPEHGQRWLLNRLVSQYIPNSLVGRKVVVDLARKARRNDVSALWRELGGRVGLRGARAQPPEIAQRVYQWWRTQDVLLVLHDVNCLPEQGLQDLIRDFWLPLAESARNLEAEIEESKLYMFLLDYEGRTSDWDLPFVEKLDLTWNPQIPIKSPKLAHISYDDLENWIANEFDDLPTELTDTIDDTVEAILDNTDSGIPERVLEELCAYCGCNWYDVKGQWLKL